MAKPSYISLNTPISDIYMVGDIYAKRLAKLDIYTAHDLLYHIPSRYNDFSNLSKISEILENSTVSVKVDVLEIKNLFTKSGKKITKAIVADDTGKIEVIWFNQPFLTTTIKKGSQVYLSGKSELQGFKTILNSPEYEVLKTPETNRGSLINPPVHTARLVPVYPETHGVSSKWLRSRIVPLINTICPTLQDILPPKIISKENFPSLSKALSTIHYPDSLIEALAARNRLAFDEIFLIQLSSLIRKKQWQDETVGKTLFVDQEKVLGFINSLPFNLTNAQKRSVKEILDDLSKTSPMNRLLEGDVGSGKTVVGAIAMYITFLNGLQSSLMAPTEILAEQHYSTLNSLLTQFNIKVALKTAGRKVSLDNFDVIVGTHALLSEKMEFNNLGLIVIDEQHRFGVEQRAILRTKGVSPHLLSMTATPIPRTMALTLYGELDLSLIDEMPKGRIPNKTWVVPKAKREGAYNWIRSQVKDTQNQAFIICPFIEESESLSTVKAAKIEYEHLKTDVFSDLRLGLLHGKLSSKEKQAVLEDFRNGKFDILVSTPVVEVGIDIKSANIMMIEASERFGLAQLHQLRGRVGRGSIQSYCLLFTSNENPDSIKRLKSLEKETVGAKLAEIDLQLRGPGELFGTKQHGSLSLKIAKLTDSNLIQKARNYAKEIVSENQSLSKYPLLKENVRDLQSQLIEAN